MSLQISSTAAQSAAQSTSASDGQKRRQDFQQLAQALQSGDLGAAQSAYSTLSKDFPNLTSNSNSPLAQVGKALQSGNLSGAQTAFASIHGGHHHHHSTSQGASSTTNTAAITNVASPASDTTGTLLNAIA